MKQLFKNYSYEFDKNEKKILSTFCKQILKQVAGNKQYFREEKVFTSILEKFESGEASVKFTKEEYFAFKNQFGNNLKHLKKELPKTGFFRKIFIKPLIKQYEILNNKYFED